MLQTIVFTVALLTSLVLVIHNINQSLSRRKETYISGFLAILMCILWGILYYLKN